MSSPLNAVATKVSLPTLTPMIVAEEFDKHWSENAQFFLDRALPDQLRDALVSLVADLPGLKVLPTYSSYSYLVASLIMTLLAARGFSIRLFDCSATINGRGLEFRLGRGPALPGQIDGHLTCIVDDHSLVDFGLGSVTRGSPFPDLPQGVACRLSTTPETSARARLPNGLEVSWKPRPAPPYREKELRENGKMADALIRRWRRRQRNRRLRMSPSVM